MDTIYAYVQKLLSFTLSLNCREAELSEDSDEEMEVDPASVATSQAQNKTPKHDLMVVEEAKARSSFFKQAKSFPMFPCKEEKLKWDEYGEAIRWEDAMNEDWMLLEIY